MWKGGMAMAENRGDGGDAGFAVCLPAVLLERFGMSMEWWILNVAFACPRDEARRIRLNARPQQYTMYDRAIRGQK